MSSNDPPTSWAIGDRLDWSSKLSVVRLVTELPFFLMMESAIVDLRYKDMDFKLLISDGDSEVFANEFWDSRINCGYQGDDPNVFESREDITALGFSLFRRKQRTTIYVTTLCHEDVLASAVGPGPKAREAMSYLETLCEVHIPVLNELIARYRLLTYDYFAYCGFREFPASPSD